MRDEIRPEHSIGFFKWLLLIFGILTLGSLITSVLALLRPSPGQPFPISFLILAAVASPLFLSAFFALQRRKRFGRWLAFFSYALGSFNIIWAFFWYVILYEGSKNIVTTAVVAGLDLIQFMLLGWGALTFAFPPKVPSERDPDVSHVPPPPPSFN
ncbi:MAG: hypothetical protein QM785_03315 [Pyrinomonadaceae bacterium]